MIYNCTTSIQIKLIQDQFQNLLFYKKYILAHLSKKAANAKKIFFKRPKLARRV